MKCERQQLGIFIAIIVLIAVFAVLQYRPLHNQAQAVEKVKAAQLSAAAKTDQQIKNLSALKDKLAQMQTKVGNYDSKIPDERSLGTFLQEIADVMNKHNLTEQMVQPDSEIQIDNLMCIPVRMQCKGNLQQIFGFLRSLSTVDRLIRIEQVQLKNDNDLNGIVTMVVRGDIYCKTSARQAGV